MEQRSDKKVSKRDNPNEFASQSTSEDSAVVMKRRQQFDRKCKKNRSTDAKVAKIETEADRHEVLATDDPDEDPPIFRLIDDCCHKIFSYLPLDDLHSFGLTCKWAQQVAGNYFQSTHRDIEIEVEEDHFRAHGLTVNGFSGFFKNLRIPYHHQMAAYRNVESNCGESIKRLRLQHLKLSSAKLKCLKNMLQTFECLKIEGCEMSPDVAEKLLKFCPELKRLCIRDDSQFYLANSTHVMIKSKNVWLLQKYPTIEHLELCVRGVSVQNMELEKFFQQNPNVQSFAIDSKFLYRYLIFFKRTKMKIEKLIVRINSALFYENIRKNIKQLSNLYERGVYQKLHMHIAYISSEEIKSLQSLDKCLERIYVYYFQQVPLFLRNITQLKEIKVIGANKEALDLVTWNNERKKVIGAQKVTVFVDNGTFVATKTKLQQTSYELVTLKQDHSNELERDFDY